MTFKALSSDKDHVDEGDGTFTAQLPALTHSSTAHSGRLTAPPRLLSTFIREQERLVEPGQRKQMVQNYMQIHLRSHYEK